MLNHNRILTKKQHDTTFITIIFAHSQQDEGYVTKLQIMLDHLTQQESQFAAMSDIDWVRILLGHLGI